MLLKTHERAVNQLVPLIRKRRSAGIGRGAEQAGKVRRIDRDHSGGSGDLARAMLEVLQIDVVHRLSLDFRRYVERLLQHPDDRPGAIVNRDVTGRPDRRTGDR